LGCGCLFSGVAAERKIVMNDKFADMIDALARFLPEQLLVRKCSLFGGALLGAILVVIRAGEVIKANEQSGIFVKLALVPLLARDEFLGGLIVGLGAGVLVGGLLDFIAWLRRRMAH
jgi:hypothetical protein